MAPTTDQIDVMLPFYGDAQHFREAVDSVRSQTYPHWRLVCVDDAYPSNDAADWLAGLDDPRITYLRNEQNLGVARNFNRCLSLVEASHFVMMGGDDQMLPEFLAVLDRVRRSHPSADVIQCGVDVIDAEGVGYLPLADRVKAAVRPRADAGLVLHGHRMAESLTVADWAYFPSILWRTERAARIGFNERWAVALDLGLLLDIALEEGTMVVIDDVVFRYRRHRASVSSATARDGVRFVQERDFFIEYGREFAVRGWRRAARIARGRVISRLNAATAVPAALRRGDGTATRRLLRVVFG